MTLHFAQLHSRIQHKRSVIVFAPTVTNLERSSFTSVNKRKVGLNKNDDNADTFNGGGGWVSIVDMLT